MAQIVIPNPDALIQQAGMTPPTSRMRAEGAARSLLESSPKGLSPSELLRALGAYGIDLATARSAMSEMVRSGVTRYADGLLTLA